MIRKTIVSTGIICTGIVIAVAVTVLQPKNVLSKNDVNWSKDVGGVSAAPACVSASVSANATCDASGNASITFSWSEINNSCQTTDYLTGEIVNVNALSINISGGGDSRTDIALPCTSSKTYSNLIQGTTYSYSLYNEYNWHPRNIMAPWPVTNGSFTVPNCTAPTPTPTPTPTPGTPPAWPTVTASCPDPGTSAVLSWNNTTGSDHYEIGVNDTTTGFAWPGTVGDLAISNYRSTSYSFSSVYGHTYNAWVTPCTSSGVCGAPPAPYITFTCPTTVYVPPPPVYYCTGSRPSNTVAYFADSNSLSYSMPWVYAVPNTSRKCEYQCNSYSKRVGTSCVPNTCTGSIPTNAMSNSYYGEETTLLSDTPWTYGYPSTSRKCEYKCNAGYLWTGTQCVVDTTPPICSDGIDNDGDGFTDYRTDSFTDPGCISPSDNDETDETDGPPPYGTLSATNCTIINGASTCSSRVIWSTSVISPSVKKEKVGLSPLLISTSLNGNVSTPISHGDTQFVLYSGSTKRITRTVTAECITGTSWNGSICTDIATSGDLKINDSDSDVTLPSGSTTTAKWTTSGGTNCSVSGASAVWSGLSGTQSETLSTTHNYVLSCDGIALDAVKVTIVDSPKLTTPRRTVTSGDTTTLNWNVGMNDSTTCSITGGSLGSSYSTLPSATGTVSVIVNANTTYTLTCSASPGGSSSVTIEVVPRGFET